MNIITALYTSLRFAPEGKTLTDMQKGAWDWYERMVEKYPDKLFGFVLNPASDWGDWVHGKGQVYWTSDKMPSAQVGLIEIDPTTMRIKEEAGL